MGRRWITIDTSRVALALARAPHHGGALFLLPSGRFPQGQIKEAEVSGTEPSSQPVHENIRQGFVYERVPHITLRSLANNSEIDVIWKSGRPFWEPIRENLNKNAPKKKWERMEIPRGADAKWTDEAKKTGTPIGGKARIGTAKRHRRINSHQTAEPGNTSTTNPNETRRRFRVGRSLHCRRVFRPPRAWALTKTTN